MEAKTWTRSSRKHVLSEFVNAGLISSQPTSHELETKSWNEKFAKYY